MSEAEAATVHEAEPDQDTSEAFPAKRRMHPNSLANLAPRFAPGVSGNPSGLTKDGEAPKVAKLRASLLAHLAKPGGMDRLAKKWLTMAMKGSYPHLAAILERLDPIEKDTGQQGKTVLQGLRLDFADGSTLTLGQQESNVQQLGPREVELEPQGGAETEAAPPGS